MEGGEEDLMVAVVGKGEDSVEDLCRGRFRGRSIRLSQNKKRFREECSSLRGWEGIWRWERVRKERLMR
jgi:hypothetical protein